MILLKLFLTFLKIGAVSFGGGYGMISMIRDDCLSNGWLSEEELLNFIAIAESTPGPIAVNMATFVGSAEGGILGALLATLGVVLPSFIIILLIATLLTKLMKYRGVKMTLAAIRPAIVGMILGFAVTMLLSVVVGLSAIGAPISFDPEALIIFSAVALTSVIYSLLRKKSISPILLIIIAGALGIIIP